MPVDDMLKEGMHSLRILVTGGAGFIESHLVDRLMRDGYEVVVLDNFSAGKVENIQHQLEGSSFHLIRDDVRDLEDVMKVVRDVDIVFHLAAIVNVPLSIKDPFLVNDLNIRGTLNLLEASLEENIERFVYISTCAVYGEARYLSIDEEHLIMPLSPYGISKFTAEHYCKIFHKIHGLKMVGLRLFNVYGPRQSEGPYSGVITQFIRRLRQGKSPIVYGDGEQTRDFVYVRDVICACMLALNSQNCVGEIINIGTGRSTTINELAKVLIRMFRETNVKPEYTPPRTGDIRRSYADISKAERILGYKSRIELEEGMRRLIEALV